MSDSTVDLYSVQFWWVVALALALVGPLTSPRARSWALAALNLGFLALLLRQDMPYVLALLFGAWAGLKVVGRLGGLAALPLGLAVLGLFVAHKLPGAIVPARSPLLNALAVIGFSYVALRLVDVGRAVSERRHPPPSFCALVNYLLPFHMIAAGPIQAYDDFVAQPAVPPPPTFRESVGALDRIASGLFKKFILANLVESLFLTGFRARGAYFFLEVQFNYLWIYLDFSGYSDIAVGVGRLIGVATPENFNRPYLARNVIDYWDRWHISLSQFVRRNVFIPLQVALMRRTGGSHALLVASRRLHDLVPPRRPLARAERADARLGDAPGPGPRRLQPLPRRADEAAEAQGAGGVHGQPVDPGRHGRRDVRVHRLRDGRAVLRLGLVVDRLALRDDLGDP